MKLRSLTPVAMHALLCFFVFGKGAVADEDHPLVQHVEYRAADYESVALVSGLKNGGILRGCVAEDRGGSRVNYCLDAIPERLNSVKLHHPCDGSALILFLDVLLGERRCRRD